MEPLSVTDMKTKLMRETMGTLGVMLLNLGKQTGIMAALRGGDKLSTSETKRRQEVETDGAADLEQRYHLFCCQASSRWCPGCLSGI